MPDQLKSPWARQRCWWIIRDPKRICKSLNWKTEHPYHHPEKLLQFIIWKIPTNSGDIWSGKLYEILSWKWDSVPKVTPIVVFDTQLVQIPFCHQLQATSPVLVVHYLGAERGCRVGTPCKIQMGPQRPFCGEYISEAMVNFHHQLCKYFMSTAKRYIHLFH